MEIGDLIAAVISAKTKYDVAFALDRLGKEESIPADDRILRLVGDDRWLVRHAAIRALSKCVSPQAEIILLERAARTNDPYDLIYINASLAVMGSSKSIPYLEKACRHQKQDVACSAIGALTRIGSVEQLPLFIDRLEKGRWVVKSYAMTAIEKHGDERAIEAVLSRVGKILSRKRKVEQLPRSELIEGLSFLYEYRRKDQRIAKLFEYTIPRKLDVLFETERSQLCQLTGQGEIL